MAIYAMLIAIMSTAWRSLLRAPVLGRFRKVNRSRTVRTLDNGITIRHAPMSELASIMSRVGHGSVDIIGRRPDGSPILSVGGGAAHQSLFESVLVSMIHSPADSTPTSYTEATYRVDMSEYEFCDIIVLVGAITDAPTFKVVENTAASGGTSSDIAGGETAEVDDSTGDESLIIISVPKGAMTKQYLGLSAIFDADGSSASIWGALAVRYGKSGNLPVTQVSADAAGSGYKTLEVLKV